MDLNLRGEAGQGEARRGLAWQGAMWRGEAGAAINCWLVFQTSQQ
jgi:hypothetical protein